MARLTSDRNLGKVIDAAQEWIHRCLIGDGSIFSEDQLWTPENIDEVRRAFVDNPDEGEGNFLTKLRGQMDLTSSHAKRLMAEIMWALLLFPSKTDAPTKRQQVAEIWAMSGDVLPSTSRSLADDVLAGIGSAGTAYQAQRWREVAFLVTLAEDLKKKPPAERQTILSDYNAFIKWIGDVPRGGDRQFRHMLRFFCFPDRVERMSSNRARQDVLAGFNIAPAKELREWSDDKLDSALFDLRQRLEKEHQGKSIDFYAPPLLEHWKKSEPEGEEPEEELSRPRRYWVEKTIVKDRPDRETGPHALGEALWSPQLGEGNRDIYKLMREVREGDVIFHFVNNKELQGISVAASQVDRTFTGIEGTEWSGRASYRIQLRDYRKLDPPINRTDFLAESEHRSRVAAILAQHRGLFFNKEFNLNQGSYLTEAPMDLVRLWNEIYLQKTGSTLLQDRNSRSDSHQTPVVHKLTSSLDTTTAEAFAQALEAAGIVAPQALVIRTLSSLASKRLMILTGLAGSGKTKLAQAIARWLSPSSSCHKVIAVGADWIGNENVLGYPNGLDKEDYVSKPALDLVLNANAHPDEPHFLILDEMNLSHVERYFADILSAIESDGSLHLHQDTVKQSNGINIPAEIPLPKNLFVIGTVNVDETTYMFSPKVLDRANVIEFRMEAAELESFLANPSKPNLSKLDGKGEAFGKTFLQAAKSQVTVSSEVKPLYDAEMLLFFKMLQAHGAEFGYRTAYETARFIHFYKALGNHPDDGPWFSGAFDCVVLQKLLPKLHGSRAKLGPVLKKLWFLCVNDAAGRSQNALQAAEEAARSTDKKAEPSMAIPDGAPYPLSAEKIARMWRLLMENGFASFAEA